MTIESEILQNVEKLPDFVKQAVFLYTKFLVKEYGKENQNEEEKERFSQKKRRSGILKGTFVLPLPGDFDEPLEDFQEYMEGLVFC